MGHRRELTANKPGADLSGVDRTHINSTLDLDEPVYRGRPRAPGGGATAAAFAVSDCGPDAADTEGFTSMFKVLLILLCLVLPFLAVLIKEGPSLRVLWAFLLQLCGHIPGVIYGIYRIVQD